MNTETPTPASTAATIASPADPLVKAEVAVEVARRRVTPRLRPLIYPALTVLATGIVVAGQIVEDLTRIPPLRFSNGRHSFRAGRSWHSFCIPS